MDITISRSSFYDSATQRDFDLFKIKISKYAFTDFTIMVPIDNVGPWWESKSVSTLPREEYAQVEQLVNELLSK